MFSSPGSSIIIGIKRGSGARKTNKGIETSVDEDAVQISLHIRIMSFLSSACKVLNTKISKARNKSLFSIAVRYFKFHARCDFQADPLKIFYFNYPLYGNPEVKRETFQNVDTEINTIYETRS